MYSAGPESNVLKAAEYFDPARTALEMFGRVRFPRHIKFPTYDRTRSSTPGSFLPNTVAAGQRTG